MLRIHVNCKLLGWGFDSNDWIIPRSSHKINRGGKFHYLKMPLGSFFLFFYKYGISCEAEIPIILINLEIKINSLTDWHTVTSINLKKVIITGQLYTKYYRYLNFIGYNEHWSWARITITVYTEPTMHNLHNKRT